MKILCVEDEPALRHLLESVLRKAGHVVVSCETGAEALHRLLGTTFDLIVADMMLPDLKGVDIIRAAKAQAPAMPAIGISAHVEDAVQQEFLDAGCGRFLSKPFHIADLLAEVRLVEGLEGRLRILLAGPIANEASFARGLRQEGFVVLAVEDGVAVGEALAREPIDVMVAEDGAIPGALELLRWKRADPARERIVTVVVTRAESDEDALLRAGAGLCLGHPLDAQPLASLLHFMVAPRAVLPAH